MSGLAELLVRQGYRVSGSDLAEGAITRRLAALGVRVHLGHRAENLGDADVVVHSTAVKEDNPELAAARARGLTVLRRGEMLARLMEGHTQVAVTGMHGKTSTTAMTAAVLRAGNLDPTVVVGSVWDGVGSNAVLGRGDVFRGRVRRVRRLLCAALPRDHHHHQPGPGAPGLLPGPGPRPRDVCGVFAAAAEGGQGHRLRRRPASGPGARETAPTN